MKTTNTKAEVEPLSSNASKTQVTDSGDTNVKKTKKRISEGNLYGYIFISPWIIGFALFTAVPMIASFVMAFFHWDVWTFTLFAGFDTFVGFENFATVLADEAFQMAIINTLLYTIFATLISIVGGIIVGYTVLKRSKMNKVLSTVIYLPCLVIGIAFSMMMAPLFGPDSFSMSNQIFNALGLANQKWLNTPYEAVNIMIIMAFWGLGSAMLVFMAGFKNIDSAIIEAAKIDGASELKTLGYILIPNLIYIIIYQVIMGIIYGFQVFDVPMGLASATNVPSGVMGLNNSLATLVFYIYNVGFVDSLRGQAAAAGWIVFLLSAVFSVLLMVFIKKTNYYSAD